MGHALIKMDQSAAGIEYLARAIQIRRELEEIHLYESLAILAYAHKTLQDPRQALQLAEEVLDYLQRDGKFYTTEYGLRNYLYLLDTLEAFDHPRADLILQRAYNEFLQTSERIPDAPTRHAFLENVPYHREITGRWQQGQ